MRHIEYYKCNPEVMSHWAGVLAASCLLMLLCALRVPSAHRGLAASTVMLSRSRQVGGGGAVAVARMHRDAKLLLAHTIMAQDARQDLSTVAGSKGSNLSKVLAAAAQSFAAKQTAVVTKKIRTFVSRDQHLHQLRQRFAFLFRALYPY